MTCVYYIFIRQLRPDLILDRHLTILIAGASLSLEQPFGIFVRVKETALMLGLKLLLNKSQ